MSIKFDLKRDLEDTKIEELILERKIKENKMRYVEICDLINRSDMFDESLVFLIAELMSYKEGTHYSPFFYEEKKPFFKGYYKNTIVGIAPDVVICDYIDNNKNNLKELFDNKTCYKVFNKGRGPAAYQIKDTKIGVYDFENTMNNKKYISFNFLLKGFNIQNYPTYYEFEDYKYVQDYINYLFELQLKNRGKHLTYEEMDKALDDFLNLEEEKALLLK